MDPRYVALLFLLLVLISSSKEPDLCCGVFQEANQSFFSTPIADIHCPSECPNPLCINFELLKEKNAISGMIINGLLDYNKDVFSYEIHDDQTGFVKIMTDQVGTETCIAFVDFDECSKFVKLYYDDDTKVSTASTPYINVQSTPVHIESTTSTAITTYINVQSTPVHIESTTTAISTEGHTSPCSQSCQTVDEGHTVDIEVIIIVLAIGLFLTGIVLTVIILAVCKYSWKKMPATGRRSDPSTHQTSKENTGSLETGMKGEGSGSGSVLIVGGKPMAHPEVV